MSADSLAMSTAVSTEMPTSAAWSAGASLMPSPMKPTTCPCACSARMMRCLCAGERRAKSVVVSAACGELVVAHRLDLAARAGREPAAMPDLVADLAADQLVVAREDLDRDAVAVQRRRCAARRGLLRRVEERDVALEHQVALVVFAGVGAVARLDVAGRRAPARGSRRRSAARTPPSGPR